ncbi:hypothetical protein [Streptacidiphilus anmyonensis]|uniref:hypothetical protein n=1 Tax=Streptacidiphilus anmyonensis TaxID=405782 RepID=UPI0007C7EB61|nr:hypothetical protein [Streptacidiphilus anmyonensis]
MLNHRRKSRRRIPLLAGLLTALLGIVALVGSALAATAPAGPGAPAAQASATQPPATPNPDCTLRVPAGPLTAAGLATPYQLTATDAAKGPCHEADPAQSAFVQATVVDPATGALFVYNPLVVDRGTRPARPPVVPKLPAHAVVGLWFGFNGDNLTLRGNTASGHCVNGTPGSIFGQFAYCNAPAFFTAANRARQAGRLRVPRLGVGRDGAPCPTTRDFGIVDQDQSDNVTTAYLAEPDGRTAQHTSANTRALSPRGAVALDNGSDNLLLTAFVDPPLGCTPWAAPDLADPGHKATALALDELQAAADQAAPVALVPSNDPMVLGSGGTKSRGKTDLYRVGVDQLPVGRGRGTDPGDGPTYCRRLATLGAARLRTDGSLFAASVSPTAGQNLLDFLTQRLTASLQNLGCPQQFPPGGASATASASASPSASASATAPAAGASATAPGTGPTPPAPSPTPSGSASTGPASVLPPTGAPTQAAAQAAAGASRSPAVALVGDVVVSPDHVAVGSTGAASAAAARSATQLGLADTGVSPRLWPFAGMGLAVLLLGCAIRLLAGARRR